MGQQLDARVASDMAAKARDTASDLAAETEKALHDKMDPSTPVLRELKETAGTALHKAAELARKASAPLVQAANAVHGAAHDVGQAATTVYQQSARAGESVSRYAAEQPLTALLVAAAIGYGLAYLIHRP